MPYHISTPYSVTRPFMAYFHRASVRLRTRRTEPRATGPDTVTYCWRPALHISAYSPPFLLSGRIGPVRCAMTIDSCMNMCVPPCPATHAADTCSCQFALSIVCARRATHHMCCCAPLVVMWTRFKLRAMLMMPCATAHAQAAARLRAHGGMLVW